jgi:hypothetical protein
VDVDPLEVLTAPRPPASPPTAANAATPTRK